MMSQMLLNHHFYQMNGLGNRILLVDMRERADKITPALAAHLHTLPTLAYDQLMVLENPRHVETLAFVRIFNSDGSESSACGNGTRCVAWLLLKNMTHGLIETKAGILTLEKQSEWSYKVDMGEPRLHWQDIPLAEEFANTARIELSIGPADNPTLHSPAVVSMGNPHAVFFTQQNLNEIALDKIGPLLENHPLFPEKANISIVKVLSKSHIQQRVWERGVGLTLACGSGACAAVVSCARLKLTGREVTVSLPGGDLQIEWLPNNHVMMAGAVELERELAFTQDMLTC